MPDDNPVRYRVAIELLGLGLPDNPSQLDRRDDEQSDVSRRIWELPEEEVRHTLLAMAGIVTVLIGMLAPGTERQYLQDIALSLNRELPD